MNMKSGIIASAFISMAFMAHAQQVTSVSGLNSGSISNSVSANAGVAGVGTSISGATSSAVSTSAVNLGAGKINHAENCVASVGGVGAISAATTSSVTGTAFNYSAGTGATGSASVSASSVAHADGKMSYSAPGQTLALEGISDISSSGTLKADKNQSAAFSNSADGSFTATGNVASVTEYSVTKGGCGVKCGEAKATTITGAVSDTKTSNAVVNNTVLNVTGLPQNAVLTNATVSGTASSSVLVNGKFSDPK